MPVDYKSFSSAAKSRFRKFAREFGFEQISGVFYVKQVNDIFYVVSIQKSSGNDFFYVNYGIGIPYLWQLEKNLDASGVNSWFFGQRLEDDFRQGFDCETKLQLESSVENVIQLFKEQAVPWFSQFQSLTDARDLYFTRGIATDDKLGSHEWGAITDVINYGFFHYHCGNIEKAKLWLTEAERLQSLPVYINDKYETVHERPKGARVYKMSAEDSERLELIQTALNRVNGANA